MTFSDLHTTGTKTESPHDAETAEFCLRCRVVGQLVPDAGSDPALKDRPVGGSLGAREAQSDSKQGLPNCLYLLCFSRNGLLCNPWNGLVGS